MNWLFRLSKKRILITFNLALFKFWQGGKKLPTRSIWQHLWRSLSSLLTTRMVTWFAKNVRFIDVLLCCHFGTSFEILQIFHNWPGPEWNWNPTQWQKKLWLNQIKLFMGPKFYFLLFTLVNLAALFVWFYLKYWNNVNVWHMVALKKLSLIRVVSIANK